MKKRPTEGAHTRARTLRRNMTDAEKKIWQVLRREQIEGLKFRRQVPIGRYIGDFVCHERQLVIEIDGGQHDLMSDKEMTRTRFIESQGYQVLRFWNSDVMDNLDGVHEVIAATLRDKGRAGLPELSCLRHLDHPHPTLPHQGGGLSLGGERLSHRSEN